MEEWESYPVEWWYVAVGMLGAVWVDVWPVSLVCLVGAAALWLLRDR